MSQTWRLSDPVTSNADVRMDRLVQGIFGSRFPHIDVNVTKALSLYGYLANHINESAEELSKQILDQSGNPLFSTQDIRDIQKILEQHKNTSFFRRVTGKQSGGDPLDSDPSRSKFYDKLIRKIAYPITSIIPSSLDGLFWYVFLIYNLEQMENIGPFIATAMDTITLTLPIMAEIASEGAEKLVSLAPIPYAGFAGEILGYALSLLFVLFAVSLNIGRKHFGSAFKVSLEAIPVFGDMLMDAAVNFETGAERFLINRNKLLKPVDKISPSLYDNLDYYVPDVKIHETAPPPLSYNVIKKDVSKYVIEETGVADVIAANPNLAAAVAIPNATAALAANKKAENAPAANKKADNAPAANKKAENAPAANKKADNAPAANKKAENAPAANKKAENAPATKKTNASAKKGGGTRRNKEYRRRMTRRR